MKKTIAFISLLAGMTMLFVSCGGTPSKIHTAGQYDPKDVRYFEDFYSAMETAIRNRDVERSFMFYSKHFMDKPPEYLDQLKHNTEILYANYSELSYSPASINLTINGSEALSSDEYKYIASPVDSSKFKPMDLSGTERIYWIKEDGAWKIVNWVVR